METSSSYNNDSSQIQSMTAAKSVVVSPTSVLVLMYLIIATGACFIALHWLPASLVGSQYIPVGPDSFYHARRILDTIAGMEFYQYDVKIHAPEGSLLTWPWAYDLLLAKATTILMAVTGRSDPMSILVYIPTFWVYVNALLLMFIARSLKLSLPLTALALLCFAVSPLTQELHGVGRIDHHYMELTMVFATLLSGLLWLNHEDSRRRAVLFGVCLGFAPAINNGLFILQIPFLLTLLLLWRANKLPNKNNIALVGCALLVSSLLILLPSEPFQQGEFSYYYLSWFHLYSASCSTLLIMFVAKTNFSLRNAAILSVICVLLVTKLSAQIFMGSQFMLSGIVKYGEISETASILKQLNENGWLKTIEDYSALLLLTPLILIYMIFLNFQGISRQHLYYTVFAVFGLGFLLLQQRMHYFGSFVLFLSLFLLFDTYISNKKPLRWAVLIVVTVVCCLPVYVKLSSKVPYAGSMDYTYTREIYPAFADVCKNEPGVVLAEYDDGNYIRFYTECAVISMNSIITPQHQAKILQTENLFTQSGSELRINDSWIKYVYVRRQDNIFIDKDLADVRQKNPGLRSELLLSDNTFPEGFTLVKELVLKLPNQDYVPYARLFKINEISK